MSTNTALDDIKARVEGHTEGPWRTWQHGDGPRDSGVETTWAYDGDEPKQITDWCLPADAELIAAAPKLLNALERVEALAILAETTLGYGAGGILMADALRKVVTDALV